MSSMGHDMVERLIKHEVKQIGVHVHLPNKYICDKMQLTYATNANTPNIQTAKKPVQTHPEMHTTPCEWNQSGGQDQCCWAGWWQSVWSLAAQRMRCLFQMYVTSWFEYMIDDSREIKICVHICCLTLEQYVIKHPGWISCRFASYVRQLPGLSKPV